MLPWIHQSDWNWDRAKCKWDTSNFFKNISKGNAWEYVFDENLFSLQNLQIWQNCHNKIIILTEIGIDPNVNELLAIFLIVPWEEAWEYFCDEHFFRFKICKLDQNVIVKSLYWLKYQMHMRYKWFLVENIPKGEAWEYLLRWKFLFTPIFQTRSKYHQKFIIRTQIEVGLNANEVKAIQWSITWQGERLGNIFSMIICLHPRICELDKNITNYFDWNRDRTKCKWITSNFLI